MPTLSEFHANVRLHANKGTSLDAVISSAVRQAARFLERNYSYQYMDRYVSFNVETTCGDGYIFTMPTLVKKFLFFRLSYGDETDYRYLKKVNPKEVVKLSSGSERPTAFWLDGDEYVYLDSKVDVNVPAEISYKQYTSWPADLTQSPKLIQIAEDLLLYQTMLILAAFTRNPEMGVTYKFLRDEALTTSTGAERDLEEGEANLQQVYG